MCKLFIFMMPKMATFFSLTVRIQKSRKILGHDNFLYSGSSRDPLSDKMVKIQPIPFFDISIIYFTFFLFFPKSNIPFFARINMINRILHVNPHEQPNNAYRVYIHLVLHNFINQII